MREELVVLQHQVAINLVDEIIPDLRTQHALEEGHPEAKRGGEPEGSDQQHQQPAGLIQKTAPENLDAGDLIGQLHSRHQPH